GETFLDLPAPGKDATVGPLILQGRRRRMVIPLPETRSKATQDAKSGTLDVGPVPLFAEHAAVGQELSALTWLCPQGRPPQATEVRGFVSRSGKPLFKLDPAAIVAAGACVQVADRLVTSELEPGTYTYNLRWLPSGAKKWVTLSSDFTLEAPLAPTST